MFLLVVYKNPFLFQYAYGMVNWLPEYVKMEPVLLLLAKELTIV